MLSILLSYDLKRGSVCCIEYVRHVDNQLTWQNSELLVIILCYIFIINILWYCSAFLCIEHSNDFAVWRCHWHWILTTHTHRAFSLLNMFDKIGQILCLPTLLLISLSFYMSHLTHHFIIHSSEDGSSWGWK